MFAYCLNRPTAYVDHSGDKPSLWPTLFGDHVPGAIHKTVQAHILATGLAKKELYLPGTGFADIYDPKTGEIWEIKHGGSTSEMQSTRSDNAYNQVTRYLGCENPPMKLSRGHAGAFTGAFVINYDNTSYLVTYDTPRPGVILYYVAPLPELEPAASYAYNPATKEIGPPLLLGLLACAVAGMGQLEPIRNTAHAH